jgi:hypothetical protein
MRICGEANLVVDDKVDRSTNSVIGKIRELQEVRVREKERVMRGEQRREREPALFLELSLGHKTQHHYTRGRGKERD